jgi:hypothetical protein
MQRFRGIATRHIGAAKQDCKAAKLYIEAFPKKLTKRLQPRYLSESRDQLRC